MRPAGEMRSALRSSLPDMSKPAKAYTIEELQTANNKKLPEDVDRYDLIFWQLLGLLFVTFK
jgi:hypothetical protein